MSLFQTIANNRKYVIILALIFSTLFIISLYLLFSSIIGPKPKDLRGLQYYNYKDLIQKTVFNFDLKEGDIEALQKEASSYLTLTPATSLEKIKGIKN